MLTYLPHRIVIQNETRTLFEGGAYTTSWTTSSIEWANVQSINANETYSKEKKQQITKFKIIMRYNANIKNEQRILFNNNILNIENVIDSVNRKKMIEIIANLEQTR